MPIWRVKYDVSFGDDVDRGTWRVQSEVDLQDVPLVDRPADHAQDDRSTLVTDVRTQSGAGALRLFRRWSGSVGNLSMPALGSFPMGVTFGHPERARGRLHIHNCTHEDAIVEDCTTTSFREVRI